MKKSYNKPFVSLFELRQEERVASQVCEETPDVFWIGGPDKDLALCAIIGTMGDNPNLCRYVAINLDGDNPSHS